MHPPLIWPCRRSSAFLLLLVAFVLLGCAASASHATAPVDPSYHPSAGDAADWILEGGSTGYWSGYWSASLHLFLDTQTGHLYNPATDHWFDPVAKAWYPHLDNDDDGGNDRTEADTYPSDSLSQDGAVGGAVSGSVPDATEASEARAAADDDASDSDGDANARVPAAADDTKAHGEKNDDDDDEKEDDDEPLWELPAEETDWALDAVEPELYWSEAAQLYFDRVSGQFYDPAVDKWYDGHTGEWYTLGKDG